MTENITCAKCKKEINGQRVKITDDEVYHRSCITIEYPTDVKNSHRHYPEKFIKEIKTNKSMEDIGNLFEEIINNPLKNPEEYNSIQSKKLKIIIYLSLQIGAAWERKEPALTKKDPFWNEEK